MSQSELEEHRRYLADDRKVDAYRRALAEVVGPDDVVLDLGSGTGLLGYLACDAGAASVVAVDVGDIVSLARRIAADNGYADRIRHVKAASVAMDLDEPADVAVCDQIGGLVHDAGVLRFFADARRRLLAPGARLVPASFRIHAAPVTFDQGRDAVDFWSTRPAGFDVSAGRDTAANTEWRYEVDPEVVTRLAQGSELAAFAADADVPIGGTATFGVTESGRFDGYLGWFEAQMSPSVTLPNDPWSPERFGRWCNFYPLEAAVAVEPGARIELSIDIRPRIGVISWSTRTTQADGEVVAGRQSTFGGSFLDRETVEGAVVDEPVATSADRVAALREAIDLLDGTRSATDLRAALADRVGTGFVSTEHLEMFVNDVVWLARA